MADHSFIAYPNRFVKNFDVNSNGGPFCRGQSYSFLKKLEVAPTHEELKVLTSTTGDNPLVSLFSRQCRVGWDFAKKVKDEVDFEGCALDPKELRRRQERFRGAGVLSVTPDEESYLLWLRFVDPSRSNESYVSELFHATGTLVSPSFISEWFSSRFTFKGKFKVSNLVPLDKFKPENIVYYFDFVNFISQFNPLRFKFADEKGIEGTSLFSKPGRADPCTGLVDCVPVDGDFRKRYNLIACMSADSTKQPIQYTLGEENGTSAAFMAFMEHLLIVGWFNRYDVLILDNCVIHKFGDADILQDLMWNTVGPDGLPMNVLVWCLPVCSPELMPVELVFQTLEQRLKTVRLADPRPHDDAVLYFIQIILNSMDIELMLKCMIHCGY